MIWFAQELEARVRPIPAGRVNGVPSFSRVLGTEPNMARVAYRGRGKRSEKLTAQHALHGSRSDYRGGFIPDEDRWTARRDKIQESFKVCEASTRMVLGNGAHRRQPGRACAGVCTFFILLDSSSARGRNRNLTPKELLETARRQHRCTAAIRDGDIEMPRFWRPRFRPPLCAIES